MQVQLKGLESRRMLILLAKVLLASAVMGAVCAASSHWLLANWPEQSFLAKLAALLATVIAGALVFAGAGVLLHVEELKELRDSLRRRLSRRA
jgi:peptidoglycan biosynthesis protein MviN/MurJ (putative lipid II flippase)